MYKLDYNYNNIETVIFHIFGVAKLRYFGILPIYPTLDSDGVTDYTNSHHNV